MRDKTNVSGINFQMKYPGLEAYHFPAGTSHISPCMSWYFRSPEYQTQKDQWVRDAGTPQEV